MRKKFFGHALGAAVAAALVSAACASNSPAPELTDVTSYYVRADGDDRKNAGTSEDAPFKTLARAVKAAVKTQVKTITVIGTLVESVTIKNADSTVRGIESDPDAEVKTVYINWSLDEHDPDELLIAGKPNTSTGERAVLIPAKKAKYALRIMSSTVRLEHIEISGLNVPKKAQGNVSAVIVDGGNLTLARGADITKNVCYGRAGISVSAGVVIMRDDAEISYNEGGNYAGLHLSNGSIGIMLDNARITGNKALGDGGGIALSGSSLIMRDSSAVSDNSAGDSGGGIITFTNAKRGLTSEIAMSDTAVIRGNTAAKRGGGVFLQDRLIILDNAAITGNTSAEYGGGVWIVGGGAAVIREPDTVIKNNSAPHTPDINLALNVPAVSDVLTSP
ncbi:MAG: hypothetical protein LBP20_08230 [Treponema sp.]|jgi:hypothetical protein|nr:hypothetical protein [Treponema sp.]